ncbi:MAG: hypothetical protein NVS1B11_13530 [Terriglobales bacterium]
MGCEVWADCAAEMPQSPAIKAAASVTFKYSFMDFYLQKFPHIFGCGTPFNITGRFWSVPCGQE